MRFEVLFHFTYEKAIVCISKKDFSAIVSTIVNMEKLVVVDFHRVEQQEIVKLRDFLDT